jgi:hypothetical protein
LEHEIFCFGCLGSQGSNGKKVDLWNSEKLLRVVFSTFGGQNKHLKNLKSIVGFALELVSKEFESLWGDCRFIPADWGS